MRLKKLWFKITNIGVDETALGRDVVRVRLLNQLIFVALTTSVLVLFTNILEGSFISMISVLANVILEGLALLFNYKRRYKLARHLAFIFFPTKIAITMLFNLGDFGEANIFTGLAFAAFIIYEGNKKIQIPIVMYICFLYIGAKIFMLNYYGSVSDSTNPYDEVITFPLIIVALGLIIILYQNELKKYELESQKWIEELEQKNQQLSSINDELEQFTYIASHDLKTPLRTVSSHLDLIKRHLKRKDFKAVDEDINFAKQGAKQMYRLINDILEYKRITTLEEDFEEIELNEVASIVTQNLSSIIDEKNAVIEIANLPSIKAHQSDMIVLFQNLIENGIKYNNSKTPKIQVQYHIEDTRLKIQFIDNGIGIDVEYHDKVFQFFKRLHTSSEYEGTGIGLGVSQKIVQKYNGSIQIIASNDDTQGSTFEISLPLLMKT